MSASGAKQRGNYVSEWFGQRMYPTVVSTDESVEAQSAQRCPFLSESSGIKTPCVKSEQSRGVCTINSPAGDDRQDWLVCPYRAMTPALLEPATRRLFQLPIGSNPLIRRADSLQLPAIRDEIRAHLASGSQVFAYFDAKVGGEVSIPRTEKSPEFSFDVTVVEIIQSEGTPAVGRFGILEIQTMDFHGSYRTAVRNLKENLRMYAGTFGEQFRKFPHLLSEGVEGPNIANVFKRTFYQMMFKFQLGQHERCAGCVLAIPASVWRSWIPHLGGAQLTHIEGNRYELCKPGAVLQTSSPAHIFIFDTAASQEITPSPLIVTHEVATDTASLSHFALEVAPIHALETIDALRGPLATLRQRIARLWPELGASLAIGGDGLEAPKATRGKRASSKKASVPDQSPLL